MEKKIAKGDTVLIEVKHLHGIAAQVLGVEDDDMALLRILEGGFEGYLVSFDVDDLVPLDHPKVADQHKVNLERNPKEQHVLDVHSTSRLAWAYKD
jgi:hypothetical protein